MNDTFAIILLYHNGSGLKFFFFSPTPPKKKNFRNNLKPLAAAESAERRATRAQHHPNCERAKRGTAPAGERSAGERSEPKEKNNHLGGNAARSTRPRLRAKPQRAKRAIRVSQVRSSAVSSRPPVLCPLVSSRSPRLVFVARLIQSLLWITFASNYPRLF